MERKTGIDHSSLTVRPVERDREREFQQRMQNHHYLGALRKIGNMIRYVAAVGQLLAGAVEFLGVGTQVCRAR